MKGSRGYVYIYVAKPSSTNKSVDQVMTMDARARGNIHVPCAFCQPLGELRILAELTYFYSFRIFMI